MGSIIECVKRIYKIQTPDGIKIEVESNERPLSGVMTAKLLQEDGEISSFFEKCKIIGIEKLEEEKKEERIKRKIKIKKKYGKYGHKKPKKELEIEVIEPAEMKEIEEPKHVQLAPCDRINMMIKMEGEFTRLDYQKVMEDSGYRMSNFMGYGDMEDAVFLRKIEHTGEKIGKGLRKYKVIDTIPVDSDTYREMRRQHKNKIKY
jgi:hypothetical protein